MNKNSEIQQKLENISLKYISQFETSEFQFRVFLKRRMLKLDLKLEIDAYDYFIDKIVIKMKEKNYINDKRFSEIKIQQIFRNGGSKKMIFLKLKEKGISKSIIKNSVDKFFDTDTRELASALIYIKKRKIGIYHYEKFDSKIPENLLKKWQGSLARKGFPYDIVKKVLEINNHVEAEDIINGMKI